MTKSDIEKLGRTETSAENWELLRGLLTSLWEKSFPEPEPKVEYKKGKK